jgi:hypothetical protein
MATADYSLYSPFSQVEGQWLASMQDAEAITVGESTMRRREIISSAAGIASGILRLNYFNCQKTETVSNIRYGVGSVSAGATPTLVRFGLYLENPADLSLSLVASTANDTSVFSGGTFAMYSKALQAPYLKTKGNRYAIGTLIVTAAATPTTYGNSNIAGSTAFQEPKLGAFLGGQSDLPSTITNASLSGSGLLLYNELF